MTKRPQAPRIVPDDDYTPAAMIARNRFASEVSGADLSALLLPGDVAGYRGNVENLMGFVQIPIGLAGPLLLNGTHDPRPEPLDLEPDNRRVGRARRGDHYHWLPLTMRYHRVVGSGPI
jgi:hypothetical protein